MQKLVVCAFTVLAIGVVGACSSSSDNGLGAGLGSFNSALLAVDSSPVALHVRRNPADTIPPSDTVHFKKLPYFVGTNAVDRTPTVTIEPQGTLVPNGLNNVTASFSKARIAHFNGDGLLQGDSTGTTILTYTLTDFNHNRVTQSIDIPITVTVGPL